MAQAGARFETYVRSAMTEVQLPTMAELYRQSGIPASTWSGWFRGVATPRRNSLVLAGQALNRTPEQLIAAWDGEKPQRSRGFRGTSDPLATAISRQADAITALVGELQLWRTEDRARLAQVEAVVDRLVGPTLGGSDTPGQGAPAALRETAE